MGKPHIRLMTEEQIALFEKEYWFDYDADNDEIIVHLYMMNRTTKHPGSESFSINSKIRKLTFSVEAIEIWKRLLDTTFKTTLFRVQQAVNIATVTYQPIELGVIKRLILDPNVRIKKV